MRSLARSGHSCFTENTNCIVNICAEFKLQEVKESSESAIVCKAEKTGILLDNLFAFSSKAFLRDSHAIDHND